MYQIQTYFPLTFVFVFNLDSFFLVLKPVFLCAEHQQGAAPLQNSLMDPHREAAQRGGLLLSGLRAVQMMCYHRKKKAKPAEGFERTRDGVFSALNLK